MLGNNDLHHLAQWDTRPQTTLSLYLSLDQNRDGRLSALSQMIKAKEAQMKANGGRGEAESLARDFDLATRYVQEMPPGPDRGLAIFSCTGMDRFVAYPLSLAVPNLLEVGPQPYLRPLTALTGTHKKALIVLLDQRRARFFAQDLGQTTELLDLELRSDPGLFERDGDQARAGDSRLDKWTHEARQRHYKMVAINLMNRFKEMGCEQLLIGGPKQAVEELSEELHPYLKARLGGSFNLEISARLGEVGQAAAKAQEQASHQRQQALLSVLAENMGPGGKAATGLNQVLASLYEGQVHTLFVRRGFTAPGGSCPDCTRLRHVDGLCPICGQQMTPVADVVNLAIARALESGAQLEQLESGSALDQMGGMAALLRYA